MPTPTHLVRHPRSERPVGAIYELSAHRQVALQTEDAELVELLVEGGAATPRRPPYLDAGATGVHGAYRPRPQINLFFEPPADDLARAIEAVAGEAGYSVDAVAEATH